MDFCAEETGKDEKMTVEAQRWSKRAMAIAVVICCLLLGARVFAWYSAVRFGNANVAVLISLGSAAFSDTEGLVEFYADSDIAQYEKRVNALSFVAPGYQRSLTEFKTGMIYLSRQFSLPQSERFRDLPTFHNLTLDSSDPSEEGLKKAVEKLVLSYREAL